VRDGGAVQFWRALAFSGDTQSELMRLDDGDALSVRGGLKLVDNFPALDRLSVNRQRAQAEGKAETFAEIAVAFLPQRSG
jgi:hypothetical protein